MDALTINRNKQLSLASLIAFNFALLLFRILVTQTAFYGFLIWNLILAGIPFLISSYIFHSEKIKGKKILLVTASVVWLLLLPNAPYILTDFLHFKKESSMPEWYDLLLLATFSLSGLVFGLMSMFDMHKDWKDTFSNKTAWLFIFCCSLLSGFGIYIGRYLRYNSWDVLSNPIDLVIDLLPLLFELRAVGFSLGYGLFLFLFYLFFKVNSINHS